MGGRSGKGEMVSKYDRLVTSSVRKAYRTLAAIQDTAASVDARRQRRQSDRYTLPPSVHAH